MHETKLRIVYAGTPEFAAVALAQLLKHGHQVVAVYTQPDRPAGRGRRLQPSPVKEIALEQGIPVEQPVSFRQEPEAIQRLADYAPDVMIVAAYGLLLPQAVLDVPRFGCLNIHASLLPRWRGAAPIQRAILAGDRETGVTIMQMDAGLDTGDMLLKRILPIDKHWSAGELHDRLASLGSEALLEVLADFASYRGRAQKQDPAQACYARKLEKQEAWIDWEQSAEEIQRRIRAFNPWPVAQTRIDDKVLRLRHAQVIDAASEAPAGTLVQVGRDSIEVACGRGRLKLLDGQLPGGKPLDVPALLNGHRDLFRPGIRLAADTGP